MKRITAFLCAAFCALISVSAVLAQTVPQDSFRQEGIASWYGTEFDGRPTASGEIFDSSKLTAAHPTLPFGTMLNVTNTYNNRQVTVKVNDRGPFVAARIVDLSMAAAEVLDMLATGTAPVIISAEGVLVTEAPALAPVPAAASAASSPAAAPPSAAPAQPAPPKAAVITGGIPAPGTGKIYRLQIGAYKIPRNAVDAFDKLKAVGLSPAYEQANDLYRVVLAGLKPEDIPSIAEKLYQAGFLEAVLRTE